MASGGYPDQGGTLADGAVTTAKLASGAVTDVKLGTGVPHGWTRVDVDVNAQDVDITFNGETGYGIEVIGYAPNNNAAGSTLTVQPNNLSTNQSYQESVAASGTVSGVTGASLVVAFAAASGSTAFNFTMITKSGAPRFYFGNYTYRNSSNAIVGSSVTAGVWQETATAITSIRIHSDRTDGIKAGSYFLYRAVPLAA